MTWDHPRGVDGLVGANDLLVSRHDLTIDWDARSLLAFGDQLVADFATKYDLLVIDHPHVPDAVAAGAILPLDGLMTTGALATLQRESVGKSHDSYTYEGSQWALAIDAAAQVSAYRPDLTEGIPPYWDDILDLARGGTVLWPYKPVDAFSTFATLLAQRGAQLAEPGNFLDREAAGAVLDTMMQLADRVPDWCAVADPIDVAEALSMTSEFSHAVSLFGYSNYSRPGFRKHLLVYDDVPSFDGQAAGATLGGAGIAVSASTRRPELAAAAAATLAGATAQAGLYATGGGQPGNLRAWKSPSLNALTNGFFGNTLRTLERAWVRPRVLGWPELQLEMSHIIHDCLVERRLQPDTISRMQTLSELHLPARLA